MFLVPICVLFFLSHYFELSANRKCAPVENLEIGDFPSGKLIFRPYTRKLRDFYNGNDQKDWKQFGNVIHFIASHKKVQNLAGKHFQKNRNGDSAAIRKGAE